MKSESLKEMAVRLFPDEEGIDRSRLRRQWLAAVGAVRKTKRGWICDNKQPKLTVVPITKEKSA
jgi:hypothetical protein